MDPYSYIVGGIVIIVIFLFLTVIICYLSSIIIVVYCTVRKPNGYPGANTRRRLPSEPGPTVVRQKPGPLQTIFDLHPDEVSCINSVRGNVYLLNFQIANM